ncbi:hypothetical protein RMN57_25150 [Kitasatospora sp. CM 4170]|uniref:Uncharacterized protein n=1 Tax=Kitasatospora aburaviensis TaxID=67265 RepID=A0ABW1F4M0_9ACTN|nr:hypothetical protein [Kitasatospora sp. CM 4170]WNM47747.1 hypothetical protein RMN57_25150 [Kitasatospora sp. CM 4170]
MLRLLYVLLPLLCWAFLVRTRVVGAAVLALLAGLAVALVGLQQEWYSTRAAAEFEAGYPLLSGLVVLAGALTERRLRGPRPKKESGTPVGGAAVALTVHALVGVAIGFAYRGLAYDAFLPSATEVSLPPGLTVEHDDDGYCGSNFCARTLTVGSTTGLPPAEVAARLRAALAEDGWSPGRRNLLHRRHGWLLDRRVAELGLTETTHGVELELSGSDLSDTLARP